MRLLKQLVELTDIESRNIKAFIIVLSICVITGYSCYKFGFRDGYKNKCDSQFKLGEEYGGKRIMNQMIKQLKSIGIEVHVR